MRLLCGAWLVPAASLIWIGLASTDLRHASDSSQLLALGRTQATAMLLALLTMLIGASVFVRHGAGRPDRNRSGDRGAPASALLASHGTTAALAVAAAVAGSLAERAAPILYPVAAVFGFWALLALPRVLLRSGDGWTSPLVALGVGISFQLTIGWLHLADPASVLSPVLIVEGLALAWVSASAARVDPFAATASAERVVGVEAPVVDDPVPTGLVGSVSPEPTGFAPRPAKPSIPEVMAGR